MLASGSPKGVADGLPVLHELITRQAVDGLHVLVGGGLRAEQVAPLKAAGASGFHVGSAGRPCGGDSPVSAQAVRTWAKLV